MTAKLKHIILLLSILVSSYQSIHILSHVVLDHDNAKKEFVHIHEHKCHLCQIDLKAFIPSHEFELFQWPNQEFHPTRQFLVIIRYHSIHLTFFSLRAPPFMV